MQRPDLWNVTLLVLALGGAAGAVGRSRTPVPVALSTTGESRGTEDVRVEAVNGEPALRDGSDVLVPLKRYQRIASASTIADAVLLELSEPDRVVAYTAYSAEKVWDAHRFRGKPELAGLGRVEAILELKPDLLLVSAISERDKMSRLREAGVTVFDLGPMEGWATLGPTILRIGLLLGERERAERYSTALERRAESIARDVAPKARRTALYLSVYGQQLYGGAARTSFHDILTFAGLRDVAAPHYEGWPLLGPEQVLELEPEIVVTNDGMAENLCATPGLHRLEACKRSGSVVTLPEWLLGDPGPNLVVAAELVHERVYGKPKQAGGE